VTGLRIAADVGGTFTDIAAFDPAAGKLVLGKSLSTPDALVNGIESGIGKTSCEIAKCGLFLHGSTVAINTIL